MLNKIFRSIGVLILLLLLVLVTCNYVVVNSTEDKTYYDLNEIPKNKVGLVLGTSNRITTGESNPYYTYRIEATVALYKANKIEYILVSGDNGSIYYNEPNTIKKDLVKAGIPDDVIFLDYAGFRTLDSMVRAKIVFGLDDVTIISQKFHNERAIFIAERKGLKAVGFNARDISTSQGAKVQLREYFARVKVFLDLLFNTQPRFYGDKIEIK